MNEKPPAYNENGANPGPQQQQYGAWAGGPQPPPSYGQDPSM